MPDQNNPTDASSTPAPVNPPSEPTQMPQPSTDMPPMDTPPFPSEPSPIEGAAPPDTTSGSAAPSFDIPPVVTPAEKPKRGGRKVIATILGLLVLVGGLGAGVILVRQQQDIRERAQSPSCYSECIAAGNTPSECRGLPACPTSCVGLSLSVCQNTAGCTWSNGVCITTTPQRTPTPPPQQTSTPRPTASSCVGLSISVCQARSDCMWTGGTSGVCVARVASPSPASCNSGDCYNDCVCRGNSSTECRAGCPTTTTCQTGQTFCTEGSSRVCRDLRYDSRNCGACGRACTSGQVCWQSECVASTGGADGPCPAGYTSGGSNRDAAEEACEGRCGVRESPTANRICENGEFMRPGTGTIPNWCYRCTGTAGGTSTPAPTSPPGTGPTAQCLDVKAYDTNWAQLSVAQLSQLRPGDRVRFTVAGTSVGGGSIDRARFRINGVQRPEVTQKKPGTEEYYDEYIIPSGTATFSIHAQIHHTTLGWSN